MPVAVRISAVILASAMAFQHVSAQAARFVQVRGIAFDGLRGQPLRDARITLVGGQQTATSDARGRFRFDSVSPGVHTFAMQHALLDSLGFNGLSTRATITNGRDEVRIAVPTFATLWREACAGSVPEEAGFVYGTIRNADDMRPVSNAVVEVNWTDMLLHSKGKVQQIVQHVSHGESRSDSTGSYAVCGVAVGHYLRIRASAGDSVESSVVDVSPNGVRIQRRDLVVGRISGRDSSSRGTIVGLVTDSEGRYFAEARVVLDGATEVRTSDDGRFTLRNVPPGTRQIEVLAVGLVPVTTTVDVPSRDTASISVQFSAPVSLEGVKVVAPRTGSVLAAEFTLRRKVGAGYTMDSVEVSRFQNLATLFQTFPTLTVEYRRPNYTISLPNGAGGRCVPDIRIDGLEAGFGHIADLSPAEVAGIEVYNRALIVPAKFARAGHPPECGMILVWTKYGFRNR